MVMGGDDADNTEHVTAHPVDNQPQFDGLDERAAQQAKENQFSQRQQVLRTQPLLANGYGDDPFDGLGEEEDERRREYTQRDHIALEKALGVDPKVGERFEIGEFEIPQGVGVTMVTEGVSDAPLVGGEETQIPAVHAPVVLLVVEIVRTVDVEHEDEAGQDGRRVGFGPGRGYQQQEESGDDSILDGGDPPVGRLLLLPAHPSGKVAVDALFERHVKTVRLESVRRVAGDSGRPDVILGQNSADVGTQVGVLEGFGDVHSARHFQPLAPARMSCNEGRQVVKIVADTPQLVVTVVQRPPSQPLGGRLEWVIT